MQKLLLVTFAALIGCASLLGRQRDAVQQTQELLGKLHSEIWTERCSAYEQLRRDARAMQQQSVQSAILDLLDRENRGASLAEDPAAPPPSPESYAEYIGSLGSTVFDFADWHNPNQLCILAHASFNPGSVFAKRLATAGPIVIPCLVQMSQSSSAHDRYQAVPVLVEIQAKGDQLTAEKGESIHRIVIEALHDREKMVRIQTVGALGRYGKADMIPALQEVARSDPAPAGRYTSIRKMAAEAIVAIQKRSGK